MKNPFPISTYPFPSQALQKLPDLHPGDLVVFCLAPAWSGIEKAEEIRRIGTLAMYLRETRSRPEFKDWSDKDFGTFAPPGCCDLLTSSGKIEIYHCIWFNKWVM